MWLSRSPHYKRAFVLERDAAAEALKEALGEPTVSVLHRSAATLALEAGALRDAERLVATALAMDPLEEIASVLREGLLLIGPPSEDLTAHLETVANGKASSKTNSRST